MCGVPNCLWEEPLLLAVFQESVAECAVCVPFRSLSSLDRCRIQADGYLVKLRGFAIVLLIIAPDSYVVYIAVNGVNGANGADGVAHMYVASS